MIFRVGQKVVCVDAKPRPGRDINQKLAEDAVYTVRWTGRWEGEPAVKLNELTPSSYDNPFFASRFRPAVERKTDIAIFTEMLTPQKQRERA